MNTLQDYVLPAILTCIPIALNLVINKTVKKKDILPCIIEIPKEILLLCMGFVVSYTAKSTNEVHATAGTTMMSISFVLLIVVYALCEYANNLYLSLSNSAGRERYKVIFWLAINMTVSWVSSGKFFVECLKQCLGGI